MTIPDSAYRSEPGRNARYNSARRFITKDIDPRTSSLTLYLSGEEFEIREAREDRTSSILGPHDTIQVDYSSFPAVKLTKTDYLYLVLSTNSKTGERQFALSPHRDSLVSIPSSWTMSYPSSLDEAVSFMNTLQFHLTASAVISEFCAGETLVLLEPRHIFADLLLTMASQNGIRVINVTIDDATKRPGWVSIHSNATKRLIKSILPENISCFFKNSDHENLGSRLLTCFSCTTQVKHEDYFARSDAQLDESSRMAFIPSALRSAWIKTHQQILKADKPAVITADQISPEIQPANAMTLLRWSATPTVPARVLPVDSLKTFSLSKTYWLVDLSGGLGLSLCGCKYRSISELFLPLELFYSPIFIHDFCETFTILLGCCSSLIH
jgi:hybrid polyketide synthase/nonribosomal peptide synthetase ACE1